MARSTLASVRSFVSRAFVSAPFVSIAFAATMLGACADAPPPGTAPPEAVCAVLRGHGHEMTRECNLLRELIDDINTGVETLQQEVDRSRGRPQQA